jgi:Beta galactosidase small chain
MSNAAVLCSRFGVAASCALTQLRCKWDRMTGCRGPHENYIDRQDGAPVRLYSAAVADLHTPYIAPSENGGRGGARWLALLGEHSAEDSTVSGPPGLLVAQLPPRWPPGSTPQVWGAKKQPNDTAPACEDTVIVPPESGLHFSVSRFGTGQLLVAKHQHELVPGAVHLHVDGVHMGVGGDDSWTPSVRSDPTCAGGFRRDPRIVTQLTDTLHQPLWIRSCHHPLLDPDCDGVWVAGA